jgi:hypothetical protein
MDKENNKLIKNYSPETFTLKIGQVYNSRGVVITLEDAGLNKLEYPLVTVAKIQVVHEGNVWNFIMTPTKTEIFNDLAIHYESFTNTPSNPLNAELTFNIFPKNNMLK